MKRLKIHETLSDLFLFSASFFLITCGVSELGTHLSTDESHARHMEEETAHRTARNGWTSTDGWIPLNCAPEWSQIQFRVNLAIVSSQHLYSTRSAEIAHNLNCFVFCVFGCERITHFYTVTAVRTKQLNSIRLCVHYSMRSSSSSSDGGGGSRTPFFAQPNKLQHCAQWIFHRECDIVHTGDVWSPSTTTPNRRIYI